VIRVWYSLYDRLLQRRALEVAFAKVRRASGAPGIDGQSVTDFEGNLGEELSRLAHELQSKTYRPLPVRRVTIPKPGGGERHLGIPAVRDRVVQQALLNILQPIFDPTFHPSSYGYRPGRSCQQAVSKATLFIRKYERQWVVDMDLSKCFDRLDHGLILAAVKRRVTDGSVLNLIRLFLKSGVMVDGEWQPTEVGSPQGGVISPLISNIYLDAFDQEMKRRGHRIVRYADDILILCRSESAAHHALAVATNYLEGPLLLTVNVEKTHVTHAARGVKFLGVEIGTRWIRIQRKKVTAFKEKVKRITRRSSPVNLVKVIRDLNPVLRGFANYFRMANCRGEFDRLMSWIRRRLRAKQLALWKKPSRLHRRLRQLGYRGDFPKMHMRRWRNSRSPQASYAIPNGWLTEQGLFDLSTMETGVLPQVT
jgi:RNA-directed DNA polymerase